MKKIIAVDFDGTLSLSKYGEPFVENKPLCDWMRKNKDRYTFILWTCRHGNSLIEAVKWLLSIGIIFNYVNENTLENVEKYGDCRKIYADLYIDANSEKGVPNNECIRSAD